MLQSPFSAEASVTSHRTTPASQLLPCNSPLLTLSQGTRARTLAVPSTSDAHPSWHAGPQCPGVPLRERGAGTAA